MSTVDAIDTTTTMLTETPKTNLALDTEDFLKIMLTELTNQDPFEPMKNQDLLNQMSTIQQLQSSQKMTETFSGISGQFDSFMSQLDNFLNREQLGSASKMIGQFVSGTTTEGRSALGKVVGVTIDQKDILLELDTGENINLNDVTRLGGNDSTDIVGALVVGPADSDGKLTIGIVESLELDGDNVTLHLKSGQDIPLSQATVVTADTTNYLLGQYVEGPNDVAGFVESYRIGQGDGIEGVTLLLDTGQELPLTQLENIISNPQL